MAIGVQVIKVVKDKVTYQMLKININLGRGMPWNYKNCQVLLMNNLRINLGMPQAKSNPPIIDPTAETLSLLGFRIT